MHRSHIWQGVVAGDPLDGRNFTLTERDGTDIYVVSHFEPRRPRTVRTTILRGDEGLEDFLREHRARHLASLVAYAPRRLMW